MQNLYVDIKFSKNDTETHYYREECMHWEGWWERREIPPCRDYDYKVELEVEGFAIIDSHKDDVLYYENCGHWWFPTYLEERSYDKVKYSDAKNDIEYVKHQLLYNRVLRHYDNYERMNPPHGKESIDILGVAKKDNASMMKAISGCLVSYSEHSGFPKIIINHHEYFPYLYTFLFNKIDLAEYKERIVFLSDMELYDLNGSLVCYESLQEDEKEEIFQKSSIVPSYSKTFPKNHPIRDVCQTMALVENGME